eukprot:CAMPEP_0194322156 /NCGR_PEP_ID=MMETSP0171-20130528/18323_1 /TAXON_ID=218684 /ORGANISM="Corethron pennatum, Strain L29A3" /LENGTH=378 /DNA_ID=CAMNT_0039080337 /DNA_START=24 /DNA_END=1160 /DNA_ORIENTATION=+
MTLHTPERRWESANEEPADDTEPRMIGKLDADDVWPSCPDGLVPRNTRGHDAPPFPLVLRVAVTPFPVPVPVPGRAVAAEDRVGWKISAARNVRILAISPSLGYWKAGRYVSSRKYLDDRRGWYDHLKWPTVAIVTLKTVSSACANHVTSYLNEEMEAEKFRNEMVDNGTIDQDQADRLGVESSGENEKRHYASLPAKLGSSIVRSHVVTLIMRAVESVSCSCLGPKLADRLTKDTFRSAKRKMMRMSDVPGGRVAAGARMVRTCIYANAISFFADYLVQQSMLVYGRYRECATRLKNMEEVFPQEGGDISSPFWEVLTSPSFLSDSLKLAGTRFAALVVSSIGAGIGSAIAPIDRPGWGTMVGTAVSESIFLQLIST